MAIVGLNNLCEPALLYMLLSFAVIIMIGLQNVLAGSYNNYCVGIYSCSNVNIATLFVLKVVFVLFWTWVLNIICKSGNELVSWILILIPILLMFIFIASVFFLHIDLNNYVPSIGFN
jgi:hypothetical protein